MRKAIVMLMSILTIVGIGTSVFAEDGWRPIAPPPTTETIVTDHAGK